MNNVYYELFKRSDDYVVLFDESGKIIGSSQKFDELFKNTSIKYITDILVDFESTESFINSILNNSLKNYSFKKNNGNFIAKVNVQNIEEYFHLKLILKEQGSELSLQKAFNELIETFSDPIFVYDTNNYIVYVNNAFGRFHGLSPNKIIGKHISEIYPPEISEIFIKNNVQVMQQSLPDKNESNVVNSSGDLIVASAMLQPIKNDDQTSVIGVVGIARNISEEKKLLKTKIEQEKKLLLMNEIVEKAPVRIFFTNTQNIVQYTNQKFSDYIGIPTNEIINKKIEDVFDESVVARIYKINNEIFRTRESVTYEHDVTIDGKRVISEVTKTPFYDNNGNFLGILGIATDRTQERLLEQKLIESQRLESLSILAGGFAHDFNNILSGIRGYSELLLFEESNPTKIQSLSKINSSISRASELTKKLLDIGTQGVNELKPLNINIITSEVINVVKFSTKKDIRFIENFVESPLKLIGDSGQIFQLIMNLILNGIDAIDNEGVIELVTKNIESEGDDNSKNNKLVLEVRDTGIGIEKDIQSKIFDPFFTTKRLLKTHSGNGLGLTTVFRIVKNHQADIDVVSEKGHGTSFTITFPIKDSEKFSITTNSELTQGSGGILIIDDNQEILDILKEFLDKLGYNVFLANTGLSGIEIYRQNSQEISLVLLNYIMPEINGINVYSILKTINSELKILMITGYSNINNYLNGLDLEGILPKPLDLVNLSKVISKILSR